MSEAGSGTQGSFIVRIRIEPREVVGAEPIWRGVVEDVATGERRYFQHMSSLVEFLSAYLRRMGIEHAGLEEG